MKLTEYIKQNYKGNQSAFARANNTPSEPMTKQGVGVMVRKGTYHVYDGMLVIARREVK